MNALAPQMFRPIDATAEIPQLDAIGEFLIRDAVQQVWDGRARKQIVDRYLAGWIGAEVAMETLIELDLIEYDERLLDEVQSADG